MRYLVAGRYHTLATTGSCTLNAPIRKCQSQLRSDIPMRLSLQIVVILSTTAHKQICARVFSQSKRFQRISSPRTEMATKINQKEYLKKYLSNDVTETSDGGKRKPKKKKSKSTTDKHRPNVAAKSK